ncbi:MAG TPA: hybrid sensor histidine kinase/response regulator [Kofleriaceae bacterium]|nr:hybrid sensor histidine kinase/response regulator [Kofleriaceae bacterium]
MPGDFSSMSMGEMFRAEVATHAAVIDEGLTALAAGRPADLTALATAAYSIKSAAQIVGLAAATELAQAIEGCVESAQAGRILIGAPEAEALRGALDLLREAGEAAETDPVGWTSARTREVAAARARIEGIASRRPQPRPAAPPPTPPPTSPAPSAVDMSLLDLFRMEAESHASALTQGLLALEKDPQHTDLLNQLMRAAHSIKGAARIVNIDLAVALAHVMEDCFLGALDRRVTLGGDDIDLLLRGADTLLQMASFGADVPPTMQATVADLAARIEAVLRRPTGAAELMPAAGVPAPVQRAADAPAVAAAIGGASTVIAGVADRSVRVTVQNINRLMNLAGESLVEVRRLEPFAGELHKLSLRQRGLVDLLDHLELILQDAVVDARAYAVLADAKTRALECRHSLTGRMTEFDAYARRAEDLTGRLYREAIACRMRPFADGLQGFPRMVRDLARKLGKQVELTVTGDDVGVDRDILEKLEAPLNHMLRNAIDHGIERPADRVAAGKPARGTLRLEARHWAGMLSITVADDGRGIDPARVRERIVRRGLVDADVAVGLSEAEVLDHIFVPGFSTADEVTEISGRGVGLDVVRSVVQEVGGSVRVASDVGAGTSMNLTMPITLSVIRAVVVEIAGEPYAFPMMRIDRIVSISPGDLRTLENHQYFLLEDKNVGLVSGRQVLEVEGGAAAPPDVVPVVVLSDRTRLCGVAVDRFLGEHDLVIRPLDPRLGKVADVSAASVMTDGTPLLILDVEDLLRSTMHLLQGGRLGKVGAAETGARRRKKVLIVDDSITVREVQRQILANRGYLVDTAVDGLDGWHLLRNGEFDLVISDVDMPRMNGIDLVRSIKQDPRLRDVPVMIVSYKDREEDRRRGLDAGANHYLTKSEFHDEALLHAVIDLIGDPS